MKDPREYVTKDGVRCWEFWWFNKLRGTARDGSFKVSNGTARCTYDDICGLLDAKDAEIAALKACITGLTDLVRYVVHDSFCIAPGHKSECSTGCLRCAMEAVLAAQRRGGE